MALPDRNPPHSDVGVGGSRSRSAARLQQTRRAGPVIRHDVEGVQLPGVVAESAKRRSSRLALQGGKMKLALGISRQDKRIEPIAQTANAVVKDEVLPGGLRSLVRHEQ